MTVREDKITLQPMNVVWGKRFKATVTTVADVAESLDGLYFSFNLPDTSLVAALFAVWMDIGSDPAPTVSGATMIPVVVASGATAAAIATAIAAALNGNATFALHGKASASGAVVTIKAKRPGSVATIAANTSTFTVATVQAGTGRDLGGTSGGIEVSIAGEMVDVVADQTGQQILDQILNATNVELSMTLLELTQENWEAMLGQVIGDTLMGDVSEVVGLGDSKRFKNMSQYAAELILSPVGATDLSQNLYFWKVFPMIDSINYSGQDLAQMSLTWRALRDTDKDSKINLMILGDGEQFEAA
jgi:hypothetical protein